MRWVIVLLLAGILILPVSAQYTGTPAKTYDPNTKTVTFTDTKTGTTLATIRVVDTVSSLTYYEEVLEVVPGYDFEFNSNRITSRATSQSGKYGASPAGIFYLRKSTGSRQVPDYKCTGTPEKPDCAVIGYRTVYYPVNEWIPISNTISLKTGVPYQFKFRYQKRAEIGYSHTFVEPSILGVPLGEFTWWDTNYGYKHQFNITGGTIAVSPYQLLLRVYNTSGTSTTNTFYSTNFSVLNMSDFRVVDSAETTEWYYWVNQTFNNGMDVWIRAPSVAKRPTNTTFYIYNGFAGASSLSDGNTTFLPNSYDHFEGTTLNTTVWDEFQAGGSSLSISGSVATLTGGGWPNYEAIRSDSTFPYNTSAHFKGYVDSIRDYTYHGYGDPLGIGWNPTCIYHYTTPGGGVFRVLYRTNDGASEDTNIDQDYSGTWYIVNVSRSYPDDVFYLSTFPYNYVIDHTVQFPEENMNLFNAVIDSGKTQLIDLVFARNYINPEPQIEDGYLEAEKPTTPTPTPTTTATATMTYRPPSKDIIPSNISCKKGEVWLRCNWTWEKQYNITGFVIDDQTVFLNGTLYKDNYSAYYMVGNVKEYYISLPNRNSNSLEIIEVWYKNFTYNNYTGREIIQVKTHPGSTWWYMFLGVGLIAVGYFVPIIGFLAIIVLGMGTYMAIDLTMQSYIIVTYALTFILSMVITAMRLSR